MDTNIFEQASRLKLRFNTFRGHLSVEDLWDLPLQSKTNTVNLDDIGMDLQRQLKQSSEVTSLVEPSKLPGTAVAQLKFDVIKHIISVRVAERDAKAAEKDRKEKKSRILELIHQKKDEALAGKSVEELEALAQSL